MKEQEALGCENQALLPRLLFRQSGDWLAKSVPRGTRERGDFGLRTLWETVSDSRHLAVVVELIIPHALAVGVSKRVNDPSPEGRGLKIQVFKPC